MFTRFAAAILLSLAGASPALVLGQTPPAVLGSRVRLRTISGATVEGTLLTIRADTLILQRESGQVSVSKAELHSLETWRGRGSQWRSGAELGWFAGFVATSAVYAGRMRNCVGFGCAGIVKLNAYAATGGLVGAVVGGLVGAAFTYDRWERVPLGPVRPQIAVGAGTASVGLSIQF